MKKVIALLLALTLFLPVCALADEVVNVFNWVDYIDEDVIKQFEEETGIKVNYMCFTTNEDMMVQVEASPAPLTCASLPSTLWSGCWKRICWPS